MADSFLVVGLLFPLLRAGTPSHLAWTCADLVHIVSLCEFICVSAMFVGKPLFTWSHQIPLRLASFYHFFCTVPWISGEGKEDIPFRAEYSKISHSLCVAQLWFSVSITICYKKKLSWHGFPDRYSNMALGVLNCHLLLWDNGIMFCPRPKNYLVSGS